MIKYKNNLNLSLKVIDEEDLKDRLNLNYLDLLYILVLLKKLFLIMQLIRRYA